MRGGYNAGCWIPCRILESTFNVIHGVIVSIGIVDRLAIGLCIVYGSCDIYYHLCERFDDK